MNLVFNNEGEVKKQNEINKLIKQAKAKNITKSEISQLAENALTITEAISDEKQQADFLLEIGILFYEISDYNKSNKVIFSALDIFKEIQRKEKIIQCFKYIGLGLMKLLKYTEAKEHFQLILNATSENEMSDTFFEAKLYF